MGSHEEYGKPVLKVAVQDDFVDTGSSVDIDYGAGQPGRIDGAGGPAELVLLFISSILAVRLS